MITINTPGAAYEYEYKGLSTDEKPTDCAANSLFLELDTGKFYYFDGEAWNELGAGGGGGGGGDVLYDGTLTFTLQEGSYISAPLFTMTRFPETDETVYMYIDDVQFAETASTWMHEDPDVYEAYFTPSGSSDPTGMIQYVNDSGWGGAVALVGEYNGEHTVEIRKTPKLT